MRKRAGWIRTAVALAAVAVFAMGNVSAWAQGATPAPFSKVTVSDEVAKRTLMKAKTVLYGRASSAVIAQRFSTTEGRLIRLDLGKAEGLSYYFVPGGLPIIVDNQLIGAIGVGGGNADEACAYAALNKVLGPQPPLPPPPPPAAAPAPAAKP